MRRLKDENIALKKQLQTKDETITALSKQNQDQAGQINQFQACYGFMSNIMQNSQQQHPVYNNANTYPIYPGTFFQPSNQNSTSSHAPALGYFPMNQ